MQQAVGYFLLTDPQYRRGRAQGARPAKTVGFVWYLGLGLPIYVSWVVESGLGAMFGRLIPDTHALGIDFLLPIYFLGLVMGFRKRPLWLPVVVASAVASIIAYKTVGSPWHVSIGAARRRAAGGRSCRRSHSGGEGTSHEHHLGSSSAGAVVTYLTRVGGHLVMSRFEHIHPRVEAGLNAVPAAVLTTLVAPAACSAGRPNWRRWSSPALVVAARRPAGDVPGRCGGADPARQFFG